MSAVVGHAKAEWLALFAADAVVEDPVGRPRSTRTELDRALTTLRPVTRP